MAIPYDSDDGYAGAAPLGVIVLETDETLEPEIGPVVRAAGGAVYHSRIAFDPCVTPETLVKMADDLPRAAGLLPQARFGCVGYGCTSGATVIGPDRVAKMVKSTCKARHVTDPISAVLAALAALDARSIGFLTPYSQDVSARMATLLETNGYTIAQFKTFDQAEDYKVARISEASVLAGMMQVGQGACDVVFSACTNLRSFNVIEQAEAELGKPVISSNSALIWHMLKLAGYAKAAGPGRLFQTNE